MQTCPRCGADNRDDRASCWNCFGQLAKPAMGGRSKQPPEVVEPDVAVIFPAVPPGKAVAEETPQATEEALTEETMPEEIELSAPFISDVGEETEPSLTTEPESIDLTEEAQSEGVDFTTEPFEAYEEASQEEESEAFAPFVFDVDEEAEPSLATEPESIDLTEEAQPEGVDFTTEPFEACEEASQEEEEDEAFAPIFFDMDEEAEPADDFLAEAESIFTIDEDEAFDEDEALEEEDEFEE